MWRRRREPGVFGCAGPCCAPQFSAGLFILIVLFGIYLPLFGASLLAVLLLETTVLRRIPRIRNWLGLQLPLAEWVTTEVSA